MQPGTTKGQFATCAVIAWAAALAGCLSPILGARCDPDVPCGSGYVCDVNGACELSCSRGGTANADGQCVVVPPDAGPICSCDTADGCVGPELTGGGGEVIYSVCYVNTICKLGELSDAGESSGFCVPPKYTDNGGGTVTDDVTGLLWQQDFTFSQPEVCRSDGPGEGCNWTDAQTFCSELSLGGFTTGWRLPTLPELYSLVDVGYGTLTSAAFPYYTPDVSFWTATPAGSGNAWLISLQFAYVYSGAVSTIGTVRCVR